MQDKNDLEGLEMEAFLHDLSWVPPLRTELLTHIFNGFTFLGYLPFFLIFLPMGYWLGDKAVFTRLVVLVGIVALTNSFLKDLFQDPRPDLQFAIDKRVGDSFGFPSGHSQIAVAMWFWLALEARRTWVWILAAIVATGVCLSRIYLGVHDVEDVLGGALLGVATVVIYAGFLSPEFERLQKLPLVVWLVAIAAQVPILWQIWPYEPRSQAIPGVAALMLFWLLGHRIQLSLIGHQRHPNTILAFIASVVAVAAMFFGFSQLGKFLTLNGLDMMHTLAIQMAFMALVATLAVPALFRAVGLSAPADKS